jgi:hypothetical protein
MNLRGHIGRFAALLLFVLASASLQAGVALGSEEDEQQNADPGPGYTWASSGLCQGSWEDDDQAGLCVHADFASSSSEIAVDLVEPPDPQYVLETTGAAIPKYCEGGTPGKRFKVLYATTTDRGDNYDALKDSLRDKMERVDEWVWKSAQMTGGTRHIRYVCNSDNKIQIAHAVLPSTADDSFAATLTALRSAGMGCNDTDRKCVALVDWKEKDDTGSRSDSLCGRAEIVDDDSAAQTNSNNQGNQISVSILMRRIARENGEKPLSTKWDTT